MAKFINHFKWNCLHYACLFCSQDKKLIEEILTNKEKNISNYAAPDKFGRYPLHLACKSNASIEVIEALLGQKEHRKTILEPIILTMVSKDLKERIIVFYHTENHLFL